MFCRELRKAIKFDNLIEVCANGMIIIIFYVVFTGGRIVSLRPDSSSCINSFTLNE